MKKLYLMLLLSVPLFCNYSIVFVHIGDKVPQHTKVAIAQARLFNPNADIYLLGSAKGLKPFKRLKYSHNVKLISLEKLPKTIIHTHYEANCRERRDFFRFASERFLYLWDLMVALNLENVFHLENDNMLYGNLEPMLEDFKSKYPGVGATFDNDDRCIAGLIWIANPSAMRYLASFFMHTAQSKKNDMEIIALYRNMYKQSRIDHLPIIMPEYLLQYPLVSPCNHRTLRPDDYCKHAKEFECIFDAAAIGQYFGGLDPKLPNNAPLFINERCLFNPSLLSYEWIKDEEGRKVPYAIFNGVYYKIINLHIHSKRLLDFRS